MTDPVALAARVAKTVLFPQALETDQADLVRRENLDALADAGLYGLFGPVSSGGFAADVTTAGLVVEQLAAACLTTTLIWMQHHRLVGSVQMWPGAIGNGLLGDLCSGKRRSGIVFAGLIGGPSPLQATRRSNGWVLDGHAPWVSGWGRIDVLHVTARGPDGTVVHVVLEDLDRPELSVKRHRLVALDGSGTVRLGFGGLEVDDSQVLAVVPHDPEGDGGRRLRLNGSLALGVARRCCALAGPSPLDDELDEVRKMLDTAGDEGMAEARATAVAFAHRAATRLMVVTGSRSLETNQHAQRLAREAMFLLVFGSRPGIKAALAAEFSN